MNSVVLKGKLGAGFNDDRYTLPKDGNPGDILVRTETGSAWEKQEPATSTPDWNQNDPTASDYIKNRPGGVPATVEAIFDGDVALTLVNGKYSGLIQPAEFVLETDCEYEVTLDDATFVAECIRTSDTYTDNYLVIDPITENTVGYNIMKDDSLTANTIRTRTDISHVTVKKIVSPIQKFPEEYIPDVFCTKTIFYTNTSGGSTPYALYTDGGLTTLATNAELANSYIKGVVCIRDVIYASVNNMITVTSCEITDEGVGYNERRFGTLAPIS